MKFTRSISPALVFVLLLSGCQLGPEKEQAKVELDSTQKQFKVTSPNPYKLNRVAVPSSAQKKFAQADKALANGDWQQAEIDLLWITENHPQLSGAFLNLALLYAETQQFDKADPFFNQAIAVNTQNVNAYNQYAIYLRKRGQFQQAEQFYRKALVVWPDYAQAHLNLGILYDLYMGQLMAAVEQYRQYQLLLDEPSRQIQGWIVDAERRLQQAENQD